MTRAWLVLAVALLAGCSPNEERLERRIDALEQNQRHLTAIINTMTDTDNKQTDTLLVHTESIGRLTEIMMAERQPPMSFDLGPTEYGKGKP